jgi:hypothetical protein
MAQINIKPFSSNIFGGRRHIPFFSGNFFIKATLLQRPF